MTDAPLAPDDGALDRPLILNTGRPMPRMGLGVWQIPDADTAVVVRAGIAAGVRSIDTAAIYGNERGVGEGLRAAGIPHDQIFVTSKLWRDDVGYDSALRAFDATLGRLRLETLDLYLIHWPAPARDRYVDAWKALIRLRDEGRVASIGVSNFRPAYVERIVAETGVIPAVNQVLVYPGFQQRELRAFNARQGIATVSWAPLGEGRTLADPVITGLARKHRRTPAQIILRWHLQSGLAAIPKSSHPDRIAENLALFDFRLDPADLAAIATLDRPDGRLGPDPADFN